VARVQPAFVIRARFFDPLLEFFRNRFAFRVKFLQLRPMHGADRRIAFHQQILAELARAIADGAKVRAYHAWSLVDNFEWTDGYTQRYGLTYIDFRTLKRTVKDSGLWYGRVAASNRLAI